MGKEKDKLVITFKPSKVDDVFSILHHSKRLNWDERKILLNVTKKILLRRWESFKFTPE